MMTAACACCTAEVAAMAGWSRLTMWICLLAAFLG